MLDFNFMLLLEQEQIIMATTIREGIYTFNVLSLHLNSYGNSTQSVIDVSNANPACGVKEARRSGSDRRDTHYRDTKS